MPLHYERPLLCSKVNNRKSEMEIGDNILPSYIHRSLYNNYVIFSRYTLCIAFIMQTVFIH